MHTISTGVLPGIYQYTYPSFADSPQFISVHFITEDGQQAFVSYPHHPSRRGAQLIAVRWFQSVVLLQLDGKPQLMSFIEALLTNWSGDHGFSITCTTDRNGEDYEYGLSDQLAA